MTKNTRLAAERCCRKKRSNGAYQAQVSPDGRNVYSVAISGALVEYSRDPTTGALSEIGCVTGSTASCSAVNETVHAKGMEGPAALAISPDGKSVYVVTRHRTTRSSRSPAIPQRGLLTEQGCISEETVVAGECKTTKGNGLRKPYGVTVSPDGKKRLRGKPRRSGRGGVLTRPFDRRADQLQPPTNA